MAFCLLYIFCFWNYRFDVWFDFFFVQRLKYDVTSSLSISCVFIEIECNSMLRLPNNALSASSIESPKSLLSSFSFCFFCTLTSNMYVASIFCCCCLFVKLLTHSKLLWNQRDTITKLLKFNITCTWTSLDLFNKKKYYNFRSLVASWRVFGTLETRFIWVLYSDKIDDWLRLSTKSHVQSI